MNPEKSNKNPQEINPEDLLSPEDKVKLQKKFGGGELDPEALLTLQDKEALQKRFDPTKAKEEPIEIEAELSEKDKTAIEKKFGPAKTEEEKPPEEAAGEKEAKEKSTLEETREKYVRARMRIKEMKRSIAKGGRGEVISAEEEGLLEEGYEIAQKEYFEALGKRRGELIGQEFKKVSKKLTGKKAEAAFKERIAEVVDQTLVKEAAFIYDLTTNVRLEDRPEKYKNLEELWKTAGRAVDWYRRRSLTTKLLISTGIFGGGVLAGAAGGAAGAALATGVFTGRIVQRAFGGAAAATGLEAWIQKSQEGKSRKDTIAEISKKMTTERPEFKTAEEIGRHLQNVLAEEGKGLDKKILELADKKNAEKWRRYVISAAAGALIVFGLPAKAIAGAVEMSNWHFGAPSEVESQKETVQSINQGLKEKIARAEEIVKRVDARAGSAEEKFKLIEEKMREVKTAAPAPSETLEGKGEIPYDWRGRVELPPEPKAGTTPAPEASSAVTPEKEIPYDWRERVELPPEGKPFAGGATTSEEALPPEKPEVAAPPKPIEEPPKAPETEIKAPEPLSIGGVETAERGDSIWKMAERQFEKRYGGEFGSLNEAQKNNLIANVVEEMKRNPKKFGLTSIDRVRLHQKVDFSGIFEDETRTARLFERAQSLTKTQMEYISRNGQALDQWIEEHPGRALANEKIDELLTGEKEIPAPVETELAIRAEAETPQISSPQESPLPETGEARPEGVMREEEIMLAPEETTPTEKGPLTVEQLPKLSAEDMAENERILFRRIFGFSPPEYSSLKNMRVGDLLRDIPSKAEAWDSWNKGEAGNLPARSFGKRIELAEFIRSFRPAGSMQSISISQFLQMVGPRGYLIENIL